MFVWTHPFVEEVATIRRVALPRQGVQRCPLDTLLSALTVIVPGTGGGARRADGGNAQRRPRGHHEDAAPRGGM